MKVFHTCVCGKKYDVTGGIGLHICSCGIVSHGLGTIQTSPGVYEGFGANSNPDDVLKNRDSIVGNIEIQEGS